MADSGDNPFDIFRLPGDSRRRQPQGGHVSAINPFNAAASEAEHHRDEDGMDDRLNAAARDIFTEVLGEETGGWQDPDMPEAEEDADQDVTQKPVSAGLPRLPTMPKMSRGKGGSKGGSKGGAKGSSKGARPVPELVGCWKVKYDNGRQTEFHVAAHGRVTLSEHDGTGVAYLEHSTGNDVVAGWTHRIEGHYRQGVHELLKVHKGKLTIAQWDGKAWVNGLGDHVGTTNLVSAQRGNDPAISSSTPVRAPQPVASAKARWVARPGGQSPYGLLEINATKNRGGMVQLARSRLAQTKLSTEDQETISKFVETNKLAHEVELGLKMFEAGKLHKFFTILKAHNAEFQAKSKDAKSRNQFTMVLLGKVDQSVEQLVRKIAALDKADTRTLQGLPSVMFTDKEGDVSTLSGDNGVMMWNAAGHGVRRVTSLGLHPDKGRGLTIVGPFGAAAVVDPPPGDERRKLVQELVQMAKACNVPVTGDGTPGNYEPPGVADAARQAFFDTRGKGKGGKGHGKKGKAKHSEDNPGVDEEGLEDDLASLEGDINLFVDESRVDDRAATSLRSQLPAVQRLVLDNGVLHDCQNPSAALMVRIQAAKDQAKDMGEFESGTTAPGSEDLHEHQIASKAAASKSAGPRPAGPKAVGPMKRERSRSPTRTVPPLPAGPPPRPAVPPPRPPLPDGRRPTAVGPVGAGSARPWRDALVGASAPKGGKGPPGSDHRSRSPRRSGWEGSRGNAGKGKDDRGKPGKFGGKGKDHGGRDGKLGSKGGKHQAQSHGGGEIADWLRGLDKGGMLMRYLPALEREFENLSELGAAMLASPDGSLSVVACIEPAVFETLGVEPLGHRLLLAKAIVALNATA